MNHWFLDGMSLVHLGVGIGFGLFGVRLWLTLMVAVGWEVAEHVLKIHWPDKFVFPSQDSLLNAAGDVLCAAVGWALAGPISAASGRRRARRTAR
jgi:hypothetical protein